MSQKKVASSTLYSAEDHQTWARLYARQKKLVSKYACKEFLAGQKKLALEPKQVPDRERVSSRVRKLTGWKLSKATSKNMSMQDWFISMQKRSFPVTDYIRKPESFDYTPMPDLFHDYSGHLPFFTDKKFADMARAFGAMCKKANKRQLLQISRIWSLGLEFGLIKEKGKIKILGAGLISSHRETLHAVDLIKKGRVVPFDLKQVTATPGKVYQLHKKYFVVNSVKDISDALIAYGKKEALV